jgi:mono/diheme cytochrome c family protein
VICANCHTADDALTVEFDATPWFQEADPASIMHAVRKDAPTRGPDGEAEEFARWFGLGTENRHPPGSPMLFKGINDGSPV